MCISRNIGLHVYYTRNSKKQDGYEPELKQLCTESNILGLARLYFKLRTTCRSTLFKEFTINNIRITISFLYVCMVNTIYLLSFVKPYYYSTDEDPSLRIESSAITNLRGVSRKLNKYICITI